MIGSSLGPSMGGKWRRAFQSKPLMLVLLGGTCLSPVGAAAQTTNWVGASGTYVEPSNWSAGVPSAASTAIFAGAPSTSVNGFVGSLEVGTWQFQAGAPAYTFTINSSFTFQGGGIVNNSSNAPTIVHGGVSFITFANSATAGNANVTNNSFIEFDDTSSAGTANITNNGAVTFAFNSTAGNATILNNGGGSLLSFTDFGDRRQRHDHHRRLRANAVLQQQHRRQRPAHRHWRRPPRVPEPRNRRQRNHHRDRQLRHLRGQQHWRQRRHHRQRRGFGRLLGHDRSQRRQQGQRRLDRGHQHVLRWAATSSPSATTTSRPASAAPSRRRRSAAAAARWSRSAAAR